MRALLLCALLPAALSHATAQDFYGRVVGVSDGDTLTVLEDGRGRKLRLAEIDCPERRQPFGSRAKQFTSAAAFGKLVRVAARETDRYGRLVAEVFLPDGRSLNRELVRQGLAWWYRRYSQDESYGRLEEEARLFRRGLWSEPAPVEPWRFRRIRRR